MMNDNPIYDNIKNDRATPIYDKVNTPEPEEKPSLKPEKKVVAATAGGTVGVAASTIMVWILESSLKIDIPDAVEIAIPVIVTAGLTFLAGYFKRN